MKGLLDIDDRRWRDGKGVVHTLIPAVRVGLTLAPNGVVWIAACGYRYESNRTAGPDTPTSCLACLAAKTVRG